MRRWDGFIPFLLAAGLTLGALPAAAQTIGPSPYRSFNDSPFKPFLSSNPGNYFHLEDFEDGALNTPGVSLSGGGGIFGPGQYRDSVDADDGSIDGSGNGGFSYHSEAANTVTFTFNAAALGSLPTHVGIVWTDAGTFTATPRFGTATFEAFDVLGNRVGVLGPVNLGDGEDTGQTAEDRFFGIQHAAGIAYFTMTGNGGDFELDHLQYGQLSTASAVPEPSSALLFLPALGVMAFIKRRRSA